MNPQVGERYCHYKGEVVEVTRVIKAAAHSAKEDVSIAMDTHNALTCCEIKKGDLVYGYAHDGQSYLRTAQNFTEIIAVDGWVGHRFTKIEEEEV